MAAVPRVRSNSIQGMTAGFRAASGPQPLQWPEDLAPLPSDPAAKARWLKRFDAYLAMRGPEHWRSAAQAAWLAQLVQADEQVQQLLEQLAVEGAMAVNAKGTPVPNPCVAAVASLQSFRAQLVKQVDVVGERAAKDTTARTAGQARRTLRSVGGSNALLAGDGDDFLATTDDLI